MEQIKHYILPDVTEDLHINEAKSSIALTKEVANKINELVDAYNELNATRYDILNDHAQTIRQGVVYMKDNLANTIADLFTTMNNAGEIQRILDSIFTTEYVDSLNALKEHSVNVKGFGAYGNGISDDTLAIQNAIEYAVNHGKVVHLPAGVYLITSSIILKDVELIGTPGTIIKCISNDFTAIKQDVFATKFNIRDITIIDGYIGLELIRGTHSVLENVNIKNCMVAMKVENTTEFNHNRFVNCLFNGHTYAVLLAHSQNGTLGAMHNVFDGCHFISDGGRGIITKICRDLVLSNCVFECGANAIRCEQYSTYSIDNCSFKGFKESNINSDVNIFYVMSGTNTHINSGAVYTTVEHDSINFYGTDTESTYGGITISRPMIKYGGIDTFKDFAKPVKRMQYVEE
jgi:virulence-associated protein VapD